MHYSTADQKALQKQSDQLLKSPAQATKEWVEQAIAVIKFHDWRYYVLADPIITDFEYDKLYKALQKVESDNQDLLIENSPTQRVAQGLTEDFPTVDHLVPMLSLDNSYNKEDLQAFSDRLDKMVSNEAIEFAVEPKFDGASISLVYENDKLIRAATRGNGSQGDDITANARAMKTIPLLAEFSKFGISRAEVRGEVVISHQNFTKINESRKEENEKLVADGKKPLDLFKHSRNTAAGTLRNKDPKEIQKRHLEVFIYHLSFAIDDKGTSQLGTQIESHNQALNMLGELGFRVPRQERTVLPTISKVDAFVQQFESDRDDYPFEIDGMVIKANKISHQERSGFTAHHPRWAIAFKFKAKQATTSLLDIDYQVGRTGAITPVAKLDPVILTGVTISNVSLHNQDFISEKDIRIGDTVIVERSGDVIPYIVGPISAKRNGKEKEVSFPTHCPRCKTALERPEGDSIWRCPNNLGCPSQIEEGIIHFVSKGALDIDGIGKDIVKRFMNEGLLENIAGLYSLDYAAILALEGWKDRSVEKLRTGIEASKTQAPWRLLVGLGIRHIGPTSAKLLMRHCDTSMLELKSKSEAYFADIEGIGPVVAKSLVEFFGNAQNETLLNQLEERGLNLKKEEQQMASSILEGKTFLFTGSLQLMTRDQAKEMVEKNGGKNLSGVSAKLNYLIAGEKAGSKLKKAQAIESITVLSEEAFLEMVNS